MQIEPKLPLGRKNVLQNRAERRRYSEHFLIPGAEIPSSVGTLPILGPPDGDLQSRRCSEGEILSPNPVLCRCGMGDTRSAFSHPGGCGNTAHRVNKGDWDFPLGLSEFMNSLSRKRVSRAPRESEVIMWNGSKKVL